MRGMKIFRRLLAEDRGQSFVIVALAAVALFGATGVAIDLGNVYMKRTNLQEAVDAGALAGAQLLAQGHISKAVPTANSVATQNVSNASYDPTTSGNKLTVVGHENVPMFFARLLGIASINIAVSGTASYGPQATAGGIVPIGVAQQDVGTPSATTKVSLTGQKLAAGNWGYLGIPRNGAPVCSTYPGNNDKNGNAGGASELDVNMACGAPGDFSIGTPLSPQTGVDTSHLADDIQSRINASTDPICASPATATAAACPRVVTIPVVDSFPTGNGGNGKANGNGGSSSTPPSPYIVGFAEFYLLPYDQNNGNVVGYYVKQVTVGTIAGSGNPNYGAIVVRLTS